MKKLSILFILIITVFCFGSCSKGNEEPIDLSNSATQSDKASESNSIEEEELSNQSTIIIKDEQKEIAVPEHIIFDVENSAVASIPTHIGGNIQLKINDKIYEVCLYSNELLLEKNGKVFKLWENNLENIVENATNISLSELKSYTVIKDNSTFSIDESQSEKIISVLDILFDTMPIKNEFDNGGEHLYFSNKLGADFDLYLKDDVIYSYFLDKYIDISVYSEEFHDISSSLNYLNDYT